MRIKLDIPLFLSEISHFPGDEVIEYISTDTREIFAGDLFIPIPGKNFDGRDFIPRAKEKGAIILEATDGAKSLLRIAALYKSKLKSLKYTVGITGSVGKTTAKEFIYKIASEQYKTHKTDSNENNAIGVSKTVLSASKDTEVLILEIGTNHPGEIREIVDILPPDIALITNIGTSHIGNFGSKDGIRREKISIASNEKTRLISRYEDGLGGLSFSSRTRRADVYTERDGGGVNVYKSGKAILAADCVFSENHLIEELCASVSVCLAMGMEYEAIKRGISSLSYENTRQKIMNLTKFSILSDCYNASIESFSSAFDSLSRLSGYSHRSAVIGDIDELSDMSAEIHLKLGRLAARYDLRRIYLIGSMRGCIRSGFLSAGGNAERLILLDENAQRGALAEQIINGSAENEIILFKASRRMRLEKIIEEIKGRC